MDNQNRCAQQNCDTAKNERLKKRNVEYSSVRGIRSGIRKASSSTSTKRLEKKGQEHSLHLKAGGVHVLAEPGKDLLKQKPLWSEWLPGAKRQGVMDAHPYIRF